MVEKERGGMREGGRNDGGREGGKEGGREGGREGRIEVEVRESEVGMVGWTVGREAEGENGHRDRYIERGKCLKKGKTVDN